MSHAEVAAAPQTFDELLTRLGTKRWNILYIVMLSVRLMLTPLHSLSGVYLAPWQAHTCRPLPAHLNVTLSRAACHYVIERPVTGGEFGETEEVEIACNQWDYDNSTFTTSLTSDYDWVCDQDHLRALYQSLYMIGTTMSPLLCGYLADRFGRKKVLVAASVALSAASLATCFAHSLPFILFLRVIVGCADILTGLVLALEVVEPKYRAAVAIWTGLAWAGGTALWGGMAYLLREWRHLQLAASLPTFLMFPLLFFMDESPRWLIVNGQTSRAKLVLEKAARWNKATLPPTDQLDQLFSRICKEEANQQTRTASDTSSYKGKWMPRLFWHKTIAIITVVTALCYFCGALVFDGLNLAGELYSDDLYLYLVFGALAEVPGVVFVAPLVHRIGRKRPLIASFMVCGVINICISFLPAEQVTVSFVLAMAGKMLVTAAFQIIYLYSSELFPTEVRVSGVEGTSAVGQVGSVIAPYFSTYLGPLIPWLPSAVYGIISIVTASAIVLLPETKDMALLETVADLRNPAFGKHRRKMTSDCAMEENGEPGPTTALREEPC